jgi:hypothetical protein
MFSVPNKKTLWTIVIWFAFLQMISPLIHAHFETDSPQQGQGVHMAADDLLQAIDRTPVLKNVSNGSHTIGVNKALLERFDLIPLPLLGILFVLAMLVAKSLSTLFAARFLSSLPIHLRPQSSPRAPPLF